MSARRSSLPFDGYRLIAIDVSWSVGEGREIRGLDMGILLVLTGRPAGFTQLASEGAARLAERLDVARS